MLKDYQNKMITDYDNKKKWFIIASGPSLTKTDVDLLNGKNVIAINDNYLLAPWATILYACDPQWWKWHQDRIELKLFRGLKYSQNQSWDEKDMEFFKWKFGVNFVESRSTNELLLEPGAIMQGSNSGIQAINLAIHFGATEIYLLGFDMQLTHGKAHWFGEHPNKVHTNYSKLIRFYNAVAKQAENIGLKIVNCTRETALMCFPRQSIDEVI